MYTASDLFPRCRGCNKLLARKVTRPWSIQCGRCKTVNDELHPGEERIIMVEEVTNHGDTGH